MLYFTLGMIIGLLLVVLWYLKMLLVMVNEIKRYQYTNNLKLLGFIKKEFSTFYKDLGKVINFYKRGDKNVNK